MLIEGNARMVHENASKNCLHGGVADFSWTDTAAAFLVTAILVAASVASAQTIAPSAVDVPVQLATPSGSTAPPATITLKDAIERARRNDATTLSAIADAKAAHDDRNIARAALLPNISYSTQYLGTQG